MAEVNPSIIKDKNSLNRYPLVEVATIRLPEDIMVGIFGQLSTLDVVHCMKVSKGWYFAFK